MGQQIMDTQQCEQCELRQLVNFCLIRHRQIGIRRSRPDSNVHFGVRIKKLKIHWQTEKGLCFYYPDTDRQRGKICLIILKPQVWLHMETSWWDATSQVIGLVYFWWCITCFRNNCSIEQTTFCRSCQKTSMNPITLSSVDLDSSDAV